MVDEKVIMHCNTLPEGNLALIAAPAAAREGNANEPTATTGPNKHRVA
jgi:hypothetical protein